MSIQPDHCAWKGTEATIKISPKKSRIRHIHISKKPGQSALYMLGHDTKRARDSGALEGGAGEFTWRCGGVAPIPAIPGPRQFVEREEDLDA